ncbi:MAG: branched-chain amino acid ABC transporter permease [Desulfobacter sp.]
MTEAILNTATEKPFMRAAKKKLALAGLSPLSLSMFVLLALVPLVLRDQYWLHLMTISLMFGALAIGFDLSAGFINVANWGYSAFMGVGAYTSAILLERYGISPWFGMVAGGVAAAFLGFLTGLITLRLRGMFTAILTWFLGLTLVALATQLTDLTRGAMGMMAEELFDAYTKEPYYYTILGLCFLTFCVVTRMVNSRPGLAFRAIGQSQDAAESLGMNPAYYRIINFTSSCAIAGVIGGFYAHFMCIITPEFLHTKHTIEILFIAFIGGRGSVWGGLVCAFFLIPALEFARPIVEWRFVIYGVMMIVIMIFMPEGIAPHITRAVERILPSK